MKVFVRDDGRPLKVVRGFRKQMLSAPRVTVHPTREWSDCEYAAATEKKLRNMRKLLTRFAKWGGTVEGAAVLEVGCGDGLDCLLAVTYPIGRAVGIDLRLPLFESGDKHEPTRRLAYELLVRRDRPSRIDDALDRLPVGFAVMDATRMAFPDGSFDLLWSRSVMEHVMPVEQALNEMAQVVRPGGLICHSIDPYFWPRGCHKRGVVDIPWAHARLSLAEFRRFVAESEGEAWAVERSRRHETLNRFTVRQWRDVFEAGPFEVLEWNEEPSPLAETLLEEHPEVEESLLDGVEGRDLTQGRIKVWLRNKGTGGARGSRHILTGNQETRPGAGLE